MATSAQWAAVVVNYESGDLLRQCVGSLLADTSAGSPEVVVVDNGSEDGSLERMRDAHPEVPVVSPGRNLGYSAAANRGIAATRAAIVAVCNSDVTLRPGSATPLVERFDREPDLGAVGPSIREPDGSRYPSARSFPRAGDAVGHALLGRLRPTNRFTRRYRQLDADPTVTRDVDWVSGAAIWLRRDALDAVGGWDEQFFMYAEDSDLCWRLRGAGWRVAYEPSAEVVHVQGASTDRHPYRMIVEHHRSLLRFARKRWTGMRRALLVPAAGVLSIRAGIEMIVRSLKPRSAR